MTETLPAREAAAAEAAPADLTLLVSRAYELADSLKQSACAADYLYWKDRVRDNAEVRALADAFARAKDKFAACERFGRFHPDYNAALDEVYAAQQKLDDLEPVHRFKEAEAALDALLADVALTLARAVSETVKVPDSETKAKGCGSGGSCSCGSGGCG